jgi:hypothetical protein
VSVTGVRSVLLECNRVEVEITVSLTGESWGLLVL